MYRENTKLSDKILNIIEKNVEVNTNLNTNNNTLIELFKECKQSQNQII